MRWISFWLQQNLTVSVVILLVLLARFLLRRSPKKYSYALWGIVAFRMVCDLRIPSVFSIFNYLPTFAQTDGMLSADAPLSAGADAVQTPGLSGVTPSVDPLPEVTGTHAEGVRLLAIALLAVWLCGALFVLAKGVRSYLRVKRCTRTAVLVNDAAVSGRNVWECETISSPFVLGFFRARIYLPLHLPPLERSYVLEHERYHARRHDPLLKLFAFVLLALYWMNPLAWLSYFCFVRDQEMSCDEAVLRALGGEIKKEYSLSLLSYATDHRAVGFAPIAFGESDASRRIKNVLKFKKPGPLAALAGVLLIAGIAAVSLTGKQPGPEPEHAAEPAVEVMPEENPLVWLQIGQGNDRSIVESPLPKSGFNMSDKMAIGNSYAAETYGVVTTYADVSLPNAEAQVKAECEYVNLQTMRHFTERKEARGIGRAVVYFTAPENCRVVCLRGYHQMKQGDNGWKSSTYDEYREDEAALYGWNH